MAYLGDYTECQVIGVGLVRVKLFVWWFNCDMHDVCHILNLKKNLVSLDCLLSKRYRVYKVELCTFRKDPIKFGRRSYRLILTYTTCEESQFRRISMVEVRSCTSKKRIRVILYNWFHQCFRMTRLGCFEDGRVLHALNWS